MLPLRFRQFLLLCLVIPLVRAAVVPRMAFEQLVSDSPRIVHGKVVAADVARSGQYLWTHYRIQVFDSLRGALPSEITVSEPGGTLDGVSMQVTGAVPFRLAEEVVLFLYQTPIGFWRIRGSAQGKFDVSGSASGKRVRAAMRSIETLPSVRAATGRSIDSIDGSTLTDFLNEIRREALK
ncbi:MAG: hypothetical protein ABIR70_15125 [Bryobacteraceae bacterium]